MRKREDMIHQFGFILYTPYNNAMQITNYKHNAPPLSYLANTEFQNTVFKHRPALTYLLCTYISVFSATSSWIPVSTLYGFHQVLYILLKLLYRTSTLYIACERDIS
jgi:hypothetical protein